MRFILDQQESPIGTMLLVADQTGVLHSLDFEAYESRMLRLLKRYYGDVQLERGRVCETVRSSLEAYFDGDSSGVERLQAGGGGTDFQREVWNRLRDIPQGATISYGQLASAVGRPGASRAVGLANGANPVAIVVPCHRVIGSTGKLTGFGGGLWRKRWLLEHENAIAKQFSRPIAIPQPALF